MRPVTLHLRLLLIESHELCVYPHQTARTGQLAESQGGEGGGGLDRTRGVGLREQYNGVQLARHCKGEGEGEESTEPESKRVHYRYVGTSGRHR